MTDAHALSEWPLDVVDSRSCNDAEVTAGGVALDEIDPATMESRKCPGLFLWAKSWMWAAASAGSIPADLVERSRRCRGARGEGSRVKREA